MQENSQRWTERSQRKRRRETEWPRTVRAHGFRGNSGRVEIRGWWRCWRIRRNSGSESFHLKELTGLSCPP